MPIELRRLGEADLEQMWQLEREAFNASPAHAEWWKAGVRRTGVRALARPLSLVLPSPDVSLQRQRLWMLRLVDAPSAIAARGYATGMTATVALEIADDECQSNAGRFVLVVENGCGRLEPGGGGDVRIGVGALASLYSGWASTAALAGAGLLAGGSDAQRAALDAAFAGPTPWLLDEF
jgi:predicted acetyltransferase